MKDINTVQLHSITLLNLSDHATRHQRGKFGILLGNYAKNSVSVSTSFELLFDHDLDINSEFLQKRLDQFNAVLPQYGMVGVYQLVDELSPNSATLSVLEQIHSFQNIMTTQTLQIVCTLVDVSKFAAPEETGPFRSFVHHNELVPVHTVIQANDTENIATSTIANHPNYFTAEVNKDPNDINNDFKQGKFKEDLSMAVDQLYARVATILEYLQKRRPGSETGDAEQEAQLHNLITHLSNKIISFQQKHDTIDYNDQLQTTQLSLLTGQLLALDNLKSQIAKNIIRSSIHTNPPSLDSVRH